MKGNGTVHYSQFLGLQYLHDIHATQSHAVISSIILTVVIIMTILTAVIVITKNMAKTEQKQMEQMNKEPLV